MHNEPPRETEAKYDADSSAIEALQQLSEVAGFRVVRRVHKQQDDIYFDTADAALRRAGVTLRVRRLVDGALMTYKGDVDVPTDAREAHFASRIEDEVPLDSELAAQVTLDTALPAAINISPVQHARVICGAQELFPTARLEIARTILDVQDDAGAQIEIAVDHAHGTRLSDGRTIDFDEVELESKVGGRAALARLAQALEAQIPGLRPSRDTKLGRTLQ